MWDLLTGLDRETAALSADTLPGDVTYVVEFTESLEDPHWNVIVEVGAVSGTQSVSVELPGEVKKQGFYRMKAVVQ